MTEQLRQFQSHPPRIAVSPSSSTEEECSLRPLVSDSQRQSLERLRSTTKDARLPQWTIVLRTADGQPEPALAQALGCSGSTIDRVRRRHRAEGLAGLIPAKPPGRPSRATPQYRAAMTQAIRTPPQDLGYGFSTWSVARLAQHLKRTTGVALGVDQVRRLLRRARFSVQRPKHTLRGKRDEEEFERARAELKAMEAVALSPDAAQVLIYQDETEIPSPPDAVPGLGAGRPAAAGAGARQEREAGRLRRGGLCHGPDHLHRRTDQERGPFPGLPGGAGGRVCGPEDPAGVRQRPVPHDRGGDGVAGGAPGSDRGVLAAAVLPEPEPDRAAVGAPGADGAGQWLFATLEDLVTAFRKGVGQINGHRQRMGFVFRHERPVRKAA